jgi:hypothetical protein
MTAAVESLQLDERLSTACQVRAKVAQSQPDVRPFSVSLSYDIGLGGVAVVVELSGRQHNFLI